ncbi:LysR family transcriptional regulator [Stella humosa]|uniref:LysR family transcriptional regulator n=1 Tax=Stella humosa TaxID=94 RepID=A0A3N1KS16_9PROT|nr:LysR family transcriptional regulator [Stella humosa]ROP83381.1 LysR family transcriptional regulator [Stella humosa]BBK29835.1 LysR family transcriptional regulator [Stella humosa]
MIDWDGWRAVLLLARAGTLAGAATLLGVDATTAARRLRRLEASLALRLFERQGARLVPTAACLDLLPRLEQAERALAAAESAFEQGGGGPVRVLRVTAVAFLVDHLLAPALPRLLAGRRLRVELLADNRNLSMARREADLALRLGRPDVVHDAVQRLGTVTYAVYAGRGRDAGGLPWAALSDEQAHLPESRWTARAAGAQGIEHRANRFEALARMAEGGLVRVLLPDLLARAFPALVRVGEPVELEREAWLVGHPEDAGAPHVRAGVDWLAGLFRPES